MSGASKGVASCELPLAGAVYATSAGFRSPLRASRASGSVTDWCVAFDRRAAVEVRVGVAPAHRGDTGREFGEHRLQQRLHGPQRVIGGDPRVDRHVTEEDGTR